MATSRSSTVRKNKPSNSPDSFQSWNGFQTLCWIQLYEGLVHILARSDQFLRRNWDNILYIVCHCRIKRNKPDDLNEYDHNSQSDSDESNESNDSDNDSQNDSGQESKTKQCPTCGHSQQLTTFEKVFQLDEKYKSEEDSDYTPSEPDSDSDNSQHENTNEQSDPESPHEPQQEPNTQPADYDEDPVAENDTRSDISQASESSPLSAIPSSQSKSSETIQAMTEPPNTNLFYISDDESIGSQDSDFIPDHPDEESHTQNPSMSASQILQPVAQSSQSSQSLQSSPQLLSSSLSASVSPHLTMDHSIRLSASTLQNMSRISRN